MFYVVIGHPNKGGRSISIRTAAFGVLLTSSDMKNTELHTYIVQHKLFPAIQNPQILSKW